MSIIEPRKRGRPKGKISRKPPRKLYKIDQVIRLLGITGRTIRYYDQLGLLPHVKRSDGGIRLFDDQDIELIKKIRKMQKEAKLSLTRIREFLFKNTETQEDVSQWVVLTDSSATLPEHFLKDLPIEIIDLSLNFGSDPVPNPRISAVKLWEKTKSPTLPLEVVAPTEAQFISTYKLLSNRGYTKVYSIHQSSAFSKTYKNAVGAAHKVAADIEVIPVDSGSNGAGLGLLVGLISAAIKRGDSGMEIDLLLEKQRPLVYSLTMANTMRYIVGGPDIDPDTVTSDHRHLLAKLCELKPVLCLRSGTGDFEVIECCRDKLSALRLMIELLSSEIISRGGYVQQIMISYNYLYGESVELVNELKTRYHNAVVSIAEGTAAHSVYTGPETISIGII